MSGSMVGECTDFHDARRQWLMAAAVAGAIALFPFARAYYIFYVLILVLAVRAVGFKQLWQQEDSAGIRYALYAIGLPVLLTTAAWLFMGGAQKLWLEKFGIVAISALLGMATIHCMRDRLTAERVHLIASIAILSWLAEGALQLLVGREIDCRLLTSTCADAHLASLYFSQKSKIGYYIGMMAIVPACWLIIRRHFLAAGLTLLFAGGVVMAAGSRSGMVPWAVACLVLIFVVSAPLGRLRWLFVFGFLVAAAGLVLILFHTNEAFHLRVASSLELFTGPGYSAANRALSGRLDIWIPLEAMMRNHLVFGVGPGDLDTAIRPFLQPGNAFIPLKIFHAHQGLLDIWAATGLIGLLAFIGFYAWAVSEFVRLSARGLSMRWAWLLVFLLLWFPLNSHHGFYSSELMFLTFFLLGLGLAGSREASVAAKVSDTNRVQ